MHKSYQLGFLVGHHKADIQDTIHMNILSSLLDVGELLGEEWRGEDLVDGDAAGAGDLADVVGEVALVAAGVRQLRLGDLQTDLKTE